MPKLGIQSAKNNPLPLSSTLTEGFRVQSTCDVGRRILVIVTAVMHKGGTIQDLNVGPPEHEAGLLTITSRLGI
jgi:hypothetical protein